MDLHICVHTCVYISGFLCACCPQHKHLCVYVQLSVQVWVHIYVCAHFVCNLLCMFVGHLSALCVHVFIYVHVYVLCVCNCVFAFLCMFKDVVNI